MTRTTNPSSPGSDAMVRLHASHGATRLFFANRAAADQALADRDDIAVLDLADAWQLSLRVAEQTPSLAPGTRS